MDQLPPFLKANVSLKTFNSFQIDEYCRYFCQVSTTEELLQALAFADESKLEVLFLGGGSNLLLTEAFEGIVIKIANRGIQLLDNDGKFIRLSVAAGEGWHNLVMQSLDRGWFGLENLSLIPGNVGAAPMQNIGAYGAEAGHLIRKVHFYNRESRRMESLSAEDCRFGYRESIFKNGLKGKAVIWEVEFELSTEARISTAYGDISGILQRDGITEPGPADVSRAVIEIRKSKLPDPTVLGNAGSFFKNPVLSAEEFEKLRESWPEIPFYPAPQNMVKVPAGWLIEKTGWKGHRRGNCGVHEKQALVLVNYGGARGSEILQLARDIIADVEEKTGIRLHPEVNII